MRRLPVLLVVVALAAVACRPEAVDPIARQLSAAPLTRDGDGSYALAYDGGTATMSGAADGGANTRVVFWPRQQTPAADELTCATWTSQSDDVNQEGAALRVQSGFTGTRAVTVTKGVIYGVDWVFNVHLWENPDEVPGVFKQFDLGGAFAGAGGVVPLPWRMCARVAGDRLDFKVWPLSVPEPDWGDATHGGSVDLPADRRGPGQSGWYAGHLSPGQRVTYAELVPAL